MVPGTIKMIRNLCNRIPLTFPVTITKFSNDYHRIIDVSLGFFTRFGFDSVSVSIRLIRKISSSTKNSDDRTGNLSNMVDFLFTSQLSTE